MKLLRSLSGLAIILVGGCTTFIRMPPSSRPPDPVSNGGTAAPAAAALLKAGTARVDITPPPGVSTFGHGPDARVSDGYWTRLYCRVFAFETFPEAPPNTSECGSDGGKPIVYAGGPPAGCAPSAIAPHQRFAIVPCDLAAVSGVLQRAVADRVRDVLPGARVMITATHTHAGPAHYFDGEAFGGGLSTHLPGFDDAMLAFLSERIASGIRAAFAGAERATLRWSHYDPFASPATADDSLGEGMWNLTWNRSHCAHEPLVPAVVPPSALEPLSAPRRAVDPSLHVLDVAAIPSPSGPATPRPIGSISFYAMHPTVLSSENTLLGADVDGIVSRLVEEQMRRQAGASGDPLHAVVNTNEGDMSPVWKEGTKREAVSLAREIAERIRGLRDRSAARHPSCDAGPVIDMRFTEFDIQNTSLADQRGHTCSKALVGVSVDHGACDHPTTSSSSAPKWPVDRACQGAKQVPGGCFEYALAGGENAFPHELPLAVARIGDSLITFVPAELTFSAGRSVATAVFERYRSEQAATLPRVSHSFIAGLANEYILYGTTASEYGWKEAAGGCPTNLDATTCRQTYEGAATLYGPSTVDLIADRAVVLASALATARPFPHVDEGRARDYPVGPTRARFPREANLPAGAARRKEILACTLPDGSACAIWHDDVPLGVRIAGRAWVGAAAADGRRVDDTGFSFVTRVIDTDADGATWTTIFKLAAGEPAFAATHILVHGRDADRDLTLPIVGRCNAAAEKACGTFDSKPLKHEDSPLERAEAKKDCRRCAN